MTNKTVANQRLSPSFLRALMGEIAEVHVGTTLHVTDGSSERIFYFVKGGIRLLSLAAVVSSKSREEAAPKQTEGERTPGTDDCGDPLTFRTRILNESQRVTYASSCKLSIHDQHGQVVRELPGKEGARWAIGHAGRFVCRWKPEERPVVFSSADETGLSLSWTIPDFVDALAVGRNRIVIRADKLTVIYNFAGIQVYEAELPEWEDGVITARHLVLTRSLSPRMLWFVDAESLELLWTCRSEPEGLSVW